MEVKFNFALLVIFSSVSWSVAQVNPVIMFSGSNVMRPSRDYEFSVVSSNLSRSLTMNATLSGTTEGGSKVSLEQLNQRIPPSFMRSFRMRTSTWGPGTYSLTLDFYDPVGQRSYQHFESLTYRKKRFDAFIYTDKGMYKPGDTVFFSIFSISSETLPYNPSGSSVDILDSNSVKMKTFANITFSKGKYEGSFDLNDLASDGQWRINFDGESETVTKYFEVKEYELPAYSVSISMPDRAAIPDLTFPVTIEATYTFGQSVQGDAIVTFYKNVWSWEPWEPVEEPIMWEEPVEEPMIWEGPVQEAEPAEEPMPMEGATRRKRQAGRPAPEWDGPGWWGGGRQVKQVLFTKTIQIDSKPVTFDVNIAKDLGVSSYDFVNAEVVFTERLTGKVSEAVGGIGFDPYAYEMFITSAETYTPGTPYAMTISVRRVYTGVSGPANIPIKLTIQQGSWDCTYDPVTYIYVCPNNVTTLDLTTNSLGVATASYVPLDYRGYFYITATSTVAQTAYKYPQRPSVRAVGDLDLSVTTNTPKINAPVTIEIRSSKVGLSKVNLVSIAKGIVLTNREIRIVNGLGVYTFVPNFSNAPKTEIIAYFIDPITQNVVSSQRTLSFVDILPNPLEITPAISTVRPGRSATLKVTSNRFSTVSLFIQDIASKLLRGGNDFKKTDIFNKLSAYDQIETGDLPWWFWWSENEFTKFQRSNLFATKIRIIYDDSVPEGPEGPMEGPMFDRAPESAPSFGPQQGSASPDAETQVRKDFRETVQVAAVEVINKKNLGNGIFDEILGEATTNIVMPESITTFDVVGVSMNDIYGIGLMDKPSSIRVFQNFFATASLPYSVKRGEISVININVFSYLNKNQSVTLSVSRNDANFAVVNPSGDKWSTSTTTYRQTFTIVPNKPRNFKIAIRPNKIGSIPIRITATGTLASDALEKPLKVIPEGIPKSITQSVLIMKNDSLSTYTSTLSCTLPPTAVNDTTSASASVVGDLLGPMIKGLENLIQMSYGCGEQNLLTLSPSVSVMRYLEATGQLSSTLRAKGTSYTEDGYQRQISYRRTDGSFSAFGNQDQVGSTWLTAFSVQIFILAQKFITVDSQVIQSAFNYFVSKQDPTTGAFIEYGNVIHKDMQGGSSNGVALTAFVSIVLSENIAAYPSYITARDKALDFIYANVDRSDPYALCICTYALQLGNHHGFSDLYAAMIASGVETADQMSWSKPLPSPSSSDPWWYYQPRSVDIEMTAYALKVLTTADMARALKTVKWIVSKQNSLGGYSSTQDTVQALDSLSKFAIVFNSQPGTINLRLTPNVGTIINAQVNKDNMLVVQDFVLNPLARQLDIFSGPNNTGSAIVSLTCNFYEKTSETAPRFNIRTSLPSQCNTPLRREICISYIPSEDDVASSMALVTVTLPSGYVYDNDQVWPVGSSRVETDEGLTKVDIYFYSFTSKEQCFNVDAIQKDVVEELKDSYITVVDYYDNFKKAQITYSTPKNLPICSMK